MNKRQYKKKIKPYVKAFANYDVSKLFGIPNSQIIEKRIIGIPRGGKVSVSISYKVEQEPQLIQGRNIVI